MDESETLVEGLSLCILRIDDDRVDRERLAGANHPAKGVRKESRSQAPAAPAPVHGQPSDQRHGNRMARHVTSTPAITSVAFPVGSSAPQVEPAACGKFWSTGAAAPGTPSIRALPS